MRILIATPHRNVVGGVEKYLQALIPGLLERGHSIGLLYENPFATTMEAVDPQAANLPSWCAAALGTELRQELAAWHPDVVYCQGLDDTGLERTLLEDYPAILYAHAYYGTCISGRKCHAMPRLLPCKRTLGAACLVLYYPRRCGGLHPGTMWRMFREQTERNSALRHYRAVLVASQHMYTEYERNGVDRNQLHLVPLPLSDAPPTPLPPLSKAPGGHVLFLGRLMDVKGAGNLIRAIPEAAAKLGRPLSITIAGAGPEQRSLQAMAQRLGVAANFTGWINGEQKWDLMRQADLLAVPSLWPEPFGLVGIEAGCIGLPAVGYDVGGIRAWLAPGESGELAPADPPTVSGFADAMVQALVDSEHYQRLCEGARKNAARFRLDHHLAHLETILASSGSGLPPGERQHVTPILEEA